MSTERYQPSGPEGTLSAIGCAGVIYLAGLVSGVVLSLLYLRWLN